MLASFDLIVLEKFAEMPESKTKLKGRCTCYRNVDEIWTFTLEQAEIKDESASRALNEKSDMLKIVANTCNQNPVERKEAAILTRGKPKNRKGGVFGQ